MSKSSKKVNVNLATINNDSMGKLSSYHVATIELKNLSEEYKEAKKKLVEKREAIIENRKKALEQGTTVEEAAVEFDLVPVDNELRALDNKYKDDKKPHTQAQKEALSILSENMYYAYLLASKKGDSSAKGSITIKKGKKEVTVVLEKSLKGYIKDFLVEIGAGNADNDNAIEKFAQYMSVNTSGMRVSNKLDVYAEEKREVQYNKLFMAVFFQYAIIEKKVLVVNEDNTLAMRDFSKPVEEEN